MVGKRDRFEVFKKSARAVKRVPRVGASDTVVTVAAPRAPIVGPVPFPYVQRDLARLAYQAARHRREHENKTFDPIVGTVAITECFNNNGSVAPSPFKPVDAFSAFCLNQIPAGNTAITRVGRRLNMKAIAFRGSIFAGSAGKTAQATMVLVYDRKSNKPTVIPSFTTVFTEQHAAALTNKDNAPRFKILRRWYYVIIGGQPGSTQTSNTRVVFDEFIKLKNKPVVFAANDTLGTMDAMVEGALYLYCLGNVNKGTTAPSLVMSMRIYYDDDE